MIREDASETEEFSRASINKTNMSGLLWFVESEKRVVF
jgi:hypothetical protein